MSECTHNCSTCSANCPSRNQPESLIEPAHELSTIKRVIGVVSGKGGVGKSIVTSMLAVIMQRRGLHSAILDADITGPSIPKAFGVTSEIDGDERGIFPARSRGGVDMMNIPVLGLVENMSYIKCPDCGKEIKLFGESHIEAIAEKFSYELLARIPIDPKLAELIDAGRIEDMDNTYLDAAADKIIEKTKNK